MLDKPNKQRRFLLPPTVLLASILSILGLHLWLPLADLWGSAGKAIGIAMILVALGVNLYCALEFRRRQTTIIPFHQSTALIATGLYRYSRNPIYLSMVVLLGGLAITLGTATPWIVPPLFAVVISRLFIEKEEAMLADAFGRQYLDYCRRVRRWL